MHTKLIQLIQKYDLIANFIIVAVMIFFIDFGDFYGKKNWFWLFIGFVYCIIIAFQLYSVFKRKV